MGKIQCVYDKDNNFFFHLMSVAKVGYDNAYGEKHKDSMSSEDIATMKKYEKELTMKAEIPMISLASTGIIIRQEPCFYMNISLRCWGKESRLQSILMTDTRDWQSITLKN